MMRVVQPCVADAPRLCLVFVFALSLGANLSLHGRSVPTNLTLPVLVSSSGKDPSFVTTANERLRTFSLAGRLPTTEVPVSRFAAAEFGTGGTLLAEGQGRVYSYSPRTGELSSLDPTSGRTTVLLPGGKLPGGFQDFEVSRGGVTVLSRFGGTTNIVTFVMPRTSSDGIRWTDTNLPVAAVDTAFSSEGLLLLSERDRALFELPDAELPSPGGAPKEPKLIRLLTDLPAGSVAAAEWREVLYVSLGSDLLVVPREMRAGGGIVPIPAPLNRIDSLRLTNDHLVALDASAGRIAIGHRPVPATFRLHGDATDTASRLARLFDVLLPYNVLPTRVIPVDRDDVVELMLAHQVLPPRSGSVPPEIRTLLERVLCRLNPDQCSPLRLVRGTPLRVPALPLRQGQVTTRVLLNGRTVDEVLSERLFPEDRLPDAELLSRILRANPALEQTLDAKLYRLDFIPWELGTLTQIQPGTALALINRAFRVVGQWNECVPTTAVTEFPKQATGLDATLRSERADTLKVLLGIEGSVEVRLDSVDVLSAPKALVLDALQRSCAADQSNGATHIVTEIARARRMDVRGRDRDTTVLYPEAPKLSAAAEAMVKLEPTPRPEWSVTIEQPVVIGFRAVPLPNTSPTESLAAAALRNVLSARDGSLELPVTGWRPMIVVPEAELRRGSKLRALESGSNPLADISTHQASAAGATAATSLPGTPAQDRVLTDNERRAAGERIRKAIKYPTQPPDAAEVIIAVAEKTASVDTRHPDFKRPGGASVWLKRGMTAVGEGVVVDEFPPDTPTPLQTERKFRIDTDHGTHVAGLLAGVGLPPGLAQQASLILVPMDSQPDQIRSSLSFANKMVGSPIANFSQTFPVDEQVITEIQAEIDRLHRALLVVAATDNDGLAITSASRAPIGWSDGPNVIGVAAANEKGEMLATSGFGKKFVQLLALGENILSLAKGGAYAKASGASQAAPQVAGAAALLRALGQVDPSRIKARLIGTADWQDKYEEKVWGGFLNVQRAVSNLDVNVLILRNVAAKASVSFHSTAPLKMKRFIQYRPDSPTLKNPESDESVQWGKVLRIVQQTWLPDNHPHRNLYRVVYFDGPENEVFIRKNVEFEPNQTFLLKRCAPLDGPPAQTACAPLLPEQIEDYVAAFPPQSLNFRRHLDPPN